MMMHDARMKSYYISAGEMNMDWIEVKATCMWCMSKVVQSKLDQVRISITFDMHHMLPSLQSKPCLGITVRSVGKPSTEI